MYLSKPRSRWTPGKPMRWPGEMKIPYAGNHVVKSIGTDMFPIYNIKIIGGLRCRRGSEFGPATGRSDVSCSAVSLSQMNTS
jgi:hypothetical protein